MARVTVPAAPFTTFSSTGSARATADIQDDVSTIEGTAAASTGTGDLDGVALAVSFFLMLHIFEMVKSHVPFLSLQATAGTVLGEKSHGAQALRSSHRRA